MDDVLKRFDRIVAIHIQLQSKRVVRAQELADRFQVSLRTIYRDIRSLEASGVPIYGEAGTGYSLMEGYRLPPVMFTREEAGSFVAAEKLMQKFTDKTLGSHYQTAMYKVKSVLRGAEKEWIALLESQIFVTPSQQLFNDAIPDALELLMESLAQKKQVLLHYQALQADEPSERMIEPIGLFHENNYWYVMGYCHLRKDYRQFRTDRIHVIKRSTDGFTQEHGPLENYLIKERAQEKITIKILVEQEIVKYIKNGRNYYGFVSEALKGDKVEMTFRTSDAIEGFPRWYLMFGDYAEILEPESVKARVKELVTKIKEHL